MQQAPNVTVTALSEYGCSGTITKPVNLVSANTNFNFPDSACMNKLITFQMPQHLHLLRANWAFGDGTGSTQISPTKTYASPIFTM
jgi:hypothetical protein